jgi:hypothetical protein
MRSLWEARLPRITPGSTGPIRHFTGTAVGLHPPPHGRVTGYRRRWYTSALMLRRAPERTVDERRNALEEANRVRFARAAAKRNLKSGELDIYDLLMDPSEELRGAKVEEMLFAMKGMGRIKVTRVLREVGISRSKTLVGLTHGQRDRLIGALGCEDG